MDLTGDSLSRDDEVLGERESIAMGDSEQERSKLMFSFDDDFSSLLVVGTTKSLISSFAKLIIVKERIRKKLQYCVESYL